ncbi:hypothetical protein PTTG_07770 [Puccinia triticina 1-1 BBBD Race 1]|uniref:Peroxidase n=1 Tax=Puccinia triticina (isolate 1-1 / race 1 (BBBD)) TaxID=630390 RepID=A0A180GBD5_PUCT1|nr:hypothetical protein PTTG_07770 [Puccinia triticina 1-1 BBBD Race 1]
MAPCTRVPANESGYPPQILGTRTRQGRKGEYPRAVYNDIAATLGGSNNNSGSYAPFLVRLAWHASGTYDKESKTGGSNGASMRFAPESNHGANAGLSVAREKLEPIYKKYARLGLTYSDLWMFAGVAAIQEIGGPKIPWCPGRQDGVGPESTQRSTQQSFDFQTTSKIHY